MIFYRTNLPQGKKAGISSAT